MRSLCKYLQAVGPSQKLLYPRLESENLTPSTSNERETEDYIGRPLDQADSDQTLNNKSDPEKGSMVPKRNNFTASQLSHTHPTSANVHKAIIRVECHDTGVGIRNVDVEDHRLFSPVSQTASPDLDANADALLL